MTKNYEVTRKRCFERLNGLNKELSGLMKYDTLSEKQTRDKEIIEEKIKLLLFVLHGEL